MYKILHVCQSNLCGGGFLAIYASFVEEFLLLVAIVCTLSEEVKH